MPTTSTRSKSRIKKTDPAVQKIVASMEEIAMQAEQIKSLSIKQLSAKNKKNSAEKKAILKRLDKVARFVDMTRQTLMADELDTWAQKMQNATVKKLENLVNESILIKADELTDQLNWTRQALSKARKARRVFSVEIKGKTYYPSFFADPKYERRQLESISKALGDLPGTSKLQFMLTPKGSLGSLTPLEALAKGKVAAVKIAAEGFAGR